MKKLIKLFSILIIVACNNSASSDNTADTSSEDKLNPLKEEVLHVHDVAMAKMGRLGKLQQKLEAERETVEDSVSYRQAYGRLSEAREAMMDWMRNFEIPEDADEEQVRIYLQKEKEAIEIVNTEMDSAIAEAEQLLEGGAISESDGEQPSAGGDWR